MLCQMQKMHFMRCPFRVQSARMCRRCFQNRARVLIKFSGWVKGGSVELKLLLNQAEQTQTAAGGADWTAFEQTFTVDDGFDAAALSVTAANTVLLDGLTMTKGTINKDKRAGHIPCPACLYRKSKKYNKKTLTNAKKRTIIRKAVLLRLLFGPWKTAPNISINAGVAQLVEQRIRNAQVRFKSRHQLHIETQ